MVDVVSKVVRSHLMRGIRSTNTSPERIVRSGLHRHGFRFRLNRKIEAIQPDLVLPRWRVAIFVHGCFWHRHKQCKYAYTPKTKKPFWAAKFQQNIARDVRQSKRLLRKDWRVAVIWECCLRSKIDRLSSLEDVARWIRSDSKRATFGRRPR